MNAIQEMLYSSIANYGKDDLVYAAKINFDLSSAIMQKYGIALLPLTLFNNGYKLSYEELMEFLQKNRKDLHAVIHSNQKVREWITMTISEVNRRILNA